MPPASSQPSVRVSPLRAKIEHASHPLLERLGRLPAWVPVVVVLAVAAIGAIVRGPLGAVCFGAITLGVAWLLYLAWPRLEPLERQMRLAVLLLTAVLTLVLAVPR